METNYKRTVAGSVGAGIGALLNASGRQYYILEHKTETKGHFIGESQKIIIDQIELGRDSSCQVRFDESCETVSRHHAAIVKDGDGWKLIPLSRTNPTFVNGQPLTGEWHLSSGDEIRLSSRGPLLGFIVPQGAQSLVKSIGMTERMNLFRKQALRPYKRGIILLSVFMVLAIGALVGWNIYQATQYEAKLQEKELQINAVAKDLEQKSEEIVSLQDELSKTADISSAAARRTQSQLDKAMAERRKLIEVQSQLENDVEELRHKTAERQKEEERAAEEQEIAKQEIKEIVAQDQSIEDFYDAVYYIKMNDIVIYDNENNEVARFNTENLVGGTGFMTSDGRFVTARRVVEPWYYYRGTVLGEDQKGNRWTFNDVQVCAVYGLKITANYTAYSPSGLNFKFINTDMRGINNHKVSTDKQYYSEEYKIRNKTITRRVKEKSVVLQWYDLDTRTDWASMAKKDQLTVVRGFECDYAGSLSPVAPVEVLVMGYPLRQGFEHSESLSPVIYQNNINVSGLNDKGIIELSSRRYQVGYDGAPVVLKKDNAWVIIGILSHTDTADRDVVVPISYAR